MHSTDPNRAAGRTRSRATTPTLVAVTGERSRVLVGGRIIGHLDELSDARGPRYRASRYSRAAGALVTIGDFSVQRDAIDALRYAS